MTSIMTALRLWLDQIRAAKPAPEDHRGPDALPVRITVDADGWLVGPGVIRMPSARGGASATMVAGTPVCVVRHATATPWGTGATIARSWRSSVESHSAHMTIDVVTEPARTAEVKRWRALGWSAEADQLAAADAGAAVVYQHRSLLTTAWHAYGATPSGVRTSGTIDGQHLNAISIGIEATCVGLVRRDKAGRWRGWSSAGGVGTGAVVPDDQVTDGWHTYHPSVLELERQIDAALLERFPSLAGVDVTITPSSYSANEGHTTQRVTRMAVGHWHVDPTRKTDPYPTGRGRGM